MMKHNKQYPASFTSWSRFGLALSILFIVLMAIPHSAFADTGEGWILLFTLIGLAYLITVSCWLIWLTLLATRCKRFYRGMFKEDSDLFYPRLFRQTFWEILIFQIIFWVPAGLLRLLLGAERYSEAYWYVIAIAIGTQVVLVPISYSFHRFTTEDDAPPRFEGFIAPILTIVSSLPALTLWMNWGSPTNHLFTWGFVGLVGALLLLLLSTVVASLFKTLLYKAVSGDVTSLHDQSLRNLTVIEALLIPASWIWAVALTEEIGFSIPIVINAFCTVFIWAAIIQVILTLAPNLGLLWSLRRPGWTPIFSCFAPAIAVLLLLGLVAVGQPVGYSKHLDETIIRHHPKDDSKAFERFLKMGANPNGTTSFGRYAQEPLLLAAIGLERWTLVKLLLEHGADPNITNRDGHRALIEAIKKRQPDIVKLLLEHGADPSVKDNLGYTALMAALKERQPGIVELLLEKGADINGRSKNGSTALILATISGNANNVRLLVERGADINAESKYGKTALLVAVEKRQLEVAQLLLEKGANPNFGSDEGLTALKAAIRLSNPNMLKILLENGADPNIKSDQDQAHLLTAVYKRQPEIVKLLLEKGADPNVKNLSGNTALAVSRESFLG